MGVLIRVAPIMLLLLVETLAAQPRPAFVAQPGRVVAVVLPSALLADRDVQRQLGSGLTTTFILVAAQRDADRRGGARVEIRFDLWDEAWIVRRVETDGKEERERLASRELLEKWWSAPLRVFAAAADRVALNVTLTVLPFSTAEGEDVRQWIAKPGGLSAASGGSPLITALIGTTLNAKPIRSWRWQAEVAFR